MRSKLLSVLLLFTLLLAACTPQATAAPTAAPTAAEAATQAPAPTQEPTATEVQPRTLTVLAAASLTESFTELGKMFEAQNPGVTVAYSFAGSQQLAQQLGQGAEADVFASANNKQMTAVVDAGRVDKDAPQV
ncbi:MAG: molybdate ABC transporter substrate-binding protein, partial [Chloroflexi bacterium]|nr:molybdate ABC transporter substrate-binding protein [Chloroflexota bacterium]